MTPAKAQKPLLILLAGALLLLLLSAVGVLDPAFQRPPKLDEAGNLVTRAVSSEVASTAATETESLNDTTVNGSIETTVVGASINEAPAGATDAVPDSSGTSGEAMHALVPTNNDPAALTTDGSQLKRWPAESSVPTFGEITLELFLNRTYSQDALAGVTVILDPGHGGSEKGFSVAATETSQQVDEKDIVLSLALKAGEKLTALGANVLYTRSTDTDVSLFSRVAFVADNALLRYFTLAEQNGYDTSALSTLRPLMADVIRFNHNGADSGGRGIFGGIGTVPDLRVIYDIEGGFTDTVMISLHLAESTDTELSGARAIVMSNDFIAQKNNEYAVGQSASDLPPNYTAYNTDARLKLANLLLAHVVQGVPALSTTEERIRDEDMAVLRLANVTSAILDVGYLSNASDREAIMSADGQENIAQAIANAVFQYYCLP